MRYYFHLVSDQTQFLDHTGLDIPDLATAKDEVQNTLAQLRRTMDDVEDWAGWRLEVVSSEGSLLCSVSLMATVH
ncbi:DUF6894 family protein [Microvirga tunisiensis]|uniref:DUF6894 domain-containing protein n=1 Tax=Microvirga tunisiensis TaxID=2108360 RepID=A0A5N7MHI2_9HYPH|nr:hypothetical protein [Microvirga tunisiensis]MPR08343.1 hypothetical protein [Microvirga tunisiensis]MPR26551.1 hypothetical protein [Microvirga tunisiensis]